MPEGRGTEYRIGPGQKYEKIGEVPWQSLVAGDTVYIHHRAEPYREKILIPGQGTAEQWIRILGVPGANGERPVISGDGAVTSDNMIYRWQDPKLVEWLGVIQIAVGRDMDRPKVQAPAYIEIAHLQVQDGNSSYRFKASDGSWVNYNGFAACIYARSVKHLVVRNNVLTNCGQGFYNWSGDGSSDGWWSAIQSDTVISGNHFHNNGNTGSYFEHQVYTESDGVTIEYNRFGPQRAGARGSQIKDRSSGTVIRYNIIDQSPEGWALDLVEAEESWHVIGKKPEYAQTFVYGNAIVSKGVSRPNIVHWNEDHQAGRGRASAPDGRLFFYHNTIVIYSNRSGSEPYTIFNATWGGYECPKAALPGIIDVRNNIIAVLPAQPGAKVPPVRLGYCGTENITLGVNWISPGIIRSNKLEGVSKLISPADNDPAFRSNEDLRLRAGSSAVAAGEAVATETRKNHVGGDFSAAERFVAADRIGKRVVIGAGSDLGAF